MTSISAPSRWRVIVWVAGIILLIWALVLALLFRQPGLSEQSKIWLAKTAQQTATDAENASFYLMLGFDAPSDSSPQAYGEQRWRLHIEPAEDDMKLAEASTWRFGLPCYVSMRECLPVIDANMARIDEVLAEQKAWLVRLELLLAAAAPKAPETHMMDKVPFPKQQLSSAFELNLAAVISAMDDDPEQAFADLNEHLEHLLSHLRQTNITAYRSLLQRALKVELGWLVAFLQQRPELLASAAKQLTVLQQQPELAASLEPILNRSFALAVTTFDRIDRDGVSDALDWDLQVSELLQRIIWQRHATVNALADSYTTAMSLMTGSDGIESLVDAANSWPDLGANWSDQNLIGSALVQEKLEQLSRLLKRSLMTEAYYRIAVAWLLAEGDESQLPSQVTLFGVEVPLQKRQLEQRLCLDIPLLESLDDFCLRLYQPRQLAELEPIVGSQM
ncbi:hypothetical protein IC617_14250 [Neiella sp. HB171785]|uniref:Uncharacterized protein n=1 Tax=Neiella litorisoli TaxID=2771431 RepID=A0A8J6R3P3_9GAMM|nr:hypothetical protein [Neiella litorisoli]MBD1390595.1 hypothetical protein [Neiella litorisoli]